MWNVATANLANLHLHRLSLKSLFLIDLKNFDCASLISFNDEDNDLLCDKLQTLGFVGTVYDPVIVSKFTALKVLRLRRYNNTSLIRLIDLSPMKTLVNLTELTIINEYRLSDVSVLKNMKLLTMLVLQSCDVCDISCLSNLRFLTKVLIRNCRFINDVSMLTEVRALELYQTGRENRIHMLHKLQALETDDFDLLEDAIQLVSQGRLDPLGSSVSRGDIFQLGKIKLWLWYQDQERKLESMRTRLENLGVAVTVVYHTKEF